MAVTVGRTGMVHEDHLQALRFRARHLTFTGNYEDDQSTTVVTAAELGFKQVFNAIPLGPAYNAAKTLFCPVVPVPSSDFSSISFAFGESAAAGGANAEKTDAEAFDADLLDVVFIGY